MTVDAWTFWRKALDNPSAIGTYELPLFVDTPEIGFWRYFDKRADRWVPVAFFISDDADERLCCIADGKEVEPIRMGDLWHRCCRHPISYDAYTEAAGGGRFVDEPPPIGHNLSDDPLEQLGFEFDEAVEIAKELLASEIANQARADQAAIMAKRLSNIRQKADMEHDREKRPHLEAGRMIDDRWRPLRDGVTEFVTLLKKHLQPWLDSHESSAGRTGARVSLQCRYVGEIVDVRAFFAAVCEHPDIQQALQKVANSLAKQKVPTPGLRIREEARAI
jgi:hypothetical protein